LRRGGDHYETMRKMLFYGSGHSLILKNIIYIFSIYLYACYSQAHCDDDVKLASMCCGEEGVLLPDLVLGGVEAICSADE